MFITGVNANATLSDDDDGLLHFSVSLTNGWTIPSFLADAYVSGNVTLTPILEVLCTRLYYPNSGSQYQAGLDLTVFDDETTYLSTSDASFSGVVAGDPSVRRLVAGGRATFGDTEADGNHGSLYAEMDLPVAAGITLLGNSTLSFTVPTTVSGGQTVFMPTTPSLQCHVGAGFTDPGQAPTTDIPMRDRYYAYLHQGASLDGDDTLYTTMKLTRASVESAGAGILRYHVYLDDDWPVPAFLGDTQINGGVTLSPVLQVLCVGLTYPVNSMVPVSGLTMTASGPSSPLRSPPSPACLTLAPLRRSPSNASCPVATPTRATSTLTARTAPCTRRWTSR
jgi:hypothetical protein